MRALSLSSPQHERSEFADLASTRPAPLAPITGMAPNPSRAESLGHRLGASTDAPIQRRKKRLKVDGRGKKAQAREEKRRQKEALSEEKAKRKRAYRSPASLNREQRQLEAERFHARLDAIGMTDKIAMHIRGGHARHTLSKDELKAAKKPSNVADKTVFPESMSWPQISKMIADGVPSSPEHTTPNEQPHKYGPGINVPIYTTKARKALSEANPGHNPTHMRIDFRKLEDTNGELQVATAFPISKHNHAKYGIKDED